MALKKYYDKDIEIICANSLKHYHYPILLGRIVDYKKEVSITKIKPNMQCFVCHIFLPE